MPFPLLLFFLWLWRLQKTFWAFKKPYHLHVYVWHTYSLLQKHCKKFAYLQLQLLILVESNEPISFNPRYWYSLELRKRKLLLCYLLCCVGALWWLLFIQATTNEGTAACRPSGEKRRKIPQSHKWLLCGFFRGAHTLFASFHFPPCVMLCLAIYQEEQSNVCWLVWCIFRHSFFGCVCIKFF